jgi:hypothetical protein
MKPLLTRHRIGVEFGATGPLALMTFAAIAVTLLASEASANRASGKVSSGQ